MKWLYCDSFSFLINLSTLITLVYNFHQLLNFSHEAECSEKHKKSNCISVKVQTVLIKEFSQQMRAPHRAAKKRLRGLTFSIEQEKKIKSQIVLTLI